MVQLNLYILTYNKLDKDFDVISLNPEKLAVPNIKISKLDKTIREYLDLLSKKNIIGYKPNFRLLNNIILEDIYHSIYFCVVPNNINIRDNHYKLSVKNYAIHSPNIQQIMQIIR